mmetsp:Transcript_22183/g.48213  ORF Transcript_22183/g.48213 Transcript_22183/m.48213 type:complete len:132 (+) Transcript_22183:118-513(+)
MPRGESPNWRGCLPLSFSTTLAGARLKALDMAHDLSCQSHRHVSLQGLAPLPTVARKLTGFRTTKLSSRGAPRLSRDLTHTSPLKPQAHSDCSHLCHVSPLVAHLTLSSCPLPHISHCGVVLFSAECCAEC